MTVAAHGSVLVCGAGPTGLTAAIELMRRGVDVEVIDVASEPTTLSKAAAVWRRTLEVLHGAVPAESFIRRGRVLQGIRLESSDQVLREVEFPEVSSVFPHGLLLPQCDTEQILRSRLEGLGVSIHRGCRLRSARSEDDGVTTEIETTDGVETRRFEWLIGADGAHSTVRHLLGVAFPGEAVHRRWLLADFDLEEPEPDDKIRTVLADEGMLAFFPYGGGRWRVVIDGGPVEPNAPRCDPDRAEIEEILRRRTNRSLTMGRTHWLADFRVSERQVERYRHGRILLAGDAAHVHSPAGGQGMNTSIQDAINLAWKIALVVHGASSESLLDTYDLERHPVAAGVLRDSGRMLRFAMNQGRFMRAMKRHVLPAMLGFGSVQRHAIRGLSEIGVHYHGGPLASTTKDRWIGRRCPDVPFGNAKTIYDLLRDPRPCVLELGAVIDGPPAVVLDQPAWRGFDVQWHRAADGTGAIADEASEIAGALGITRPSLVVIRPDGYLGPTGASLDVASAWVDSLRGL